MQMLTKLNVNTVVRMFVEINLNVFLTPNDLNIFYLKPPLHCTLQHTVLKRILKTIKINSNRKSRYTASYRVPFSFWYLYSSCSFVHTYLQFHQLNIIKHPTDQNSWHLQKTLYILVYTSILLRFRLLCCRFFRNPILFGVGVLVTKANSL